MRDVVEGYVRREDCSRFHDTVLSVLASGVAALMVCRSGGNASCGFEKISMV